MVKSEVWLECANHVPSSGGPKEMYRTAVKSREAGGEDGEARLVAALMRKSRSSFGETRSEIPSSSEVEGSGEGL
jgi:hypothetical protein